MEHNESISEAEHRDDDSRLSFGTYLKKVRIEKGLTIEDIMDYTRISKYVIEQIEAENRTKLPEDVFLKGFLKSYAEAVAVDPYDVLERYLKTVGHEEQSGVSVKREIPEKKSGLKWAVAGGVGLIVCLLAVATWIWVSKTSNSGGTLPEAGLGLEGNNEADPFEEAQSVTVKTDVKDTLANGLHLEVVCVEHTTLKISVDGGVPEEYVLKPEEHLELKAKKMYNILIDNTCGVTLFLNNNPVTVPGKCGQVVTLQLP